MDCKRSEFIVLPQGKINYPRVNPERCLPKSFLKASADGHSTASQGNLFGCFTTLPVRELFSIMFNANFSYCSLRLFISFPSHRRYWKRDYLFRLAAALNTLILVLPSSVSFSFLARWQQLIRALLVSWPLLASALPLLSFSEVFLGVSLPWRAPKMGRRSSAGALPAGGDQHGLLRDP